MTTRRQFLKVSLAGGAAIAFGVPALSSCAPPSTNKSGKASDGLALLTDWAYLGPAGTVQRYWEEIQSRVNESDVGFKIDNVTTQPFEDLLTTAEAQRQAKSGADVIAWYTDFFGYSLKANGQAGAVDEYVPSTEFDNWLLAECNWDGKYWGVPHALEIQVLAINRKHFEAAGVDIGDRFESHDEFIAACDKLQSAGITPIEAGYSDGSNAQKWNLFEQLLVIDDPMNIVKTVLGERDVDTPEFNRSIEWLPKLGRYMNDNASDYTEQMAVERFLNGSAAMMLMNTGPIFAENVGSEFDVVGCPTSSAQFSRPAAGAGNTLVLAEYADDKESVGKLFEFLHQPEQLTLWWELTRSLPADRRFDTSILPPAAKRTWDLLRAEETNDPFALWFPDNFYPADFAFDYYLPVPSDLLSGRLTEAEARDATSKVFEKFRNSGGETREHYEDFSIALKTVLQSNS